MTTTTDWIPVRVAAEMLGLSYLTVWRMCQRGNLDEWRPTPSVIRVRRSQVEALLPPAETNAV